MLIAPTFLLSNKQICAIKLSTVANVLTAVGSTWMIFAGVCASTALLRSVCLSCQSPVLSFCSSYCKSHALLIDCYMCFSYPPACFAVSCKRILWYYLLNIESLLLIRFTVCFTFVCTVFWPLLPSSKGDLGSVWTYCYIHAKPVNRVITRGSCCGSDTPRKIFIF